MDKHYLFLETLYITSEIRFLFVIHHFNVQIFSELFAGVYFITDKVVLTS